MARTATLSKKTPVSGQKRRPTRPYPEPMEPVSLRLTRHQIDGELVRRAIDDFLEAKGIA
jgi:hypothetical protein